MHGCAQRERGGGGGGERERERERESSVHPEREREGREREREREGERERGWDRSDHPERDGERERERGREGERERASWVSALLCKSVGLSTRVNSTCALPGNQIFNSVRKLLLVYASFASVPIQSTQYVLDQGGREREREREGEREGGGVK